MTAAHIKLKSLPEACSFPQETSLSFFLFDWTSCLACHRTLYVRHLLGFTGLVALHLTVSSTKTSLQLRVGLVRQRLDVPHMLRDDHDPVLTQEHSVSLGLVTHAADVAKLRARLQRVLTWLTVDGVVGAEGHNLPKVRRFARQCPRLAFALVGLLLSTYAAYSTASPQKDNGSLHAQIMHRAMSSTGVCMHSALPFEAWLLASLT